MFNKIKNLVSSQADKIIRDPAHASRVVVASVLVLGIFSLTLNLGIQVMPELLGAQVSPQPTTTAAAKQATAYQSAADKAILELADKCKKSRAGETPDWKEFMDNFQKSMSGILPGAGNLILNNPGVVSDRKKQLVIEIMKKYSNLKFCIPEGNFETLYQQNYKKLSQSLSPFFQVRLHEDDTAGEFPTSEVHSIFISDFSNELYYAEKDILETSIFVTDIIDRAIESAIKLDQATDTSINLLTQETSNRLAETTNYTLQQIGEINAESSNIFSAASGLLDTIVDILAIDNTVPHPISSGGSYERTPFTAELKKRIAEAKGYDPITASSISLEQLYLPVAGPPIIEEVDRLISEEKTISYGLLNLFDIKDRSAISEYLGVGMVRYVGTSLRLDPFTPGAEDYIMVAENLFGMEAVNPPEEQICYPLDPSQEERGEKCFGFAPEKPLTSA